MSDIVRRSWWLIAAGVCIGTLLALVALEFMPQVFEARSAVAIDPDELPGGVLRQDVEIRLRNQREALLSDAVLHEVIGRAFPSPSSPEAERELADVIRSRLGMSYSPGTRMVEFRYRDSEPVRAAEVVNLFARFFGENNIVSVATSPAVPVSHDRREFLAGGVAGGLLGGLLVFVGRQLSRVAVAVRGGH